MFNRQNYERSMLWTVIRYDPGVLLDRLEKFTKSNRSNSPKAVWFCTVQILGVATALVSPSFVIIIVRALVHQHFKIG